jgi:hypothetical protein
MELLKKNMKYYIFPNVTGSPKLRAPQFNQIKINKKKHLSLIDYIVTCRGSIARQRHDKHLLA